MNDDIDPHGPDALETSGELWPLDIWGERFDEPGTPKPKRSFGLDGRAAAPMATKASAFPGEAAHSQSRGQGGTHDGLLPARSGAGGACGGDGQAIARTLKEILGWLRRRIRRRNLGYLEDDLLGTATVAFYCALRTWRPERGELAPYALRYVKRDTLRLLRRENAHRTAHLSLSEVDDPTPPGSPAELPVLLRDPDNPDLRLVWTHLVEGASLRTLSDQHGISIRKVRERLRLAFRRLGLEDAEPGVPTGGRADVSGEGVRGSAA